MQGDLIGIAIAIGLFTGWMLGTLAKSAIDGINERARSLSGGKDGDGLSRFQGSGGTTRVARGWDDRRSRGSRK